MDNKIRPYVLAEINWKQVNKENYSMAVLPWGRAAMRHLSPQLVLPLEEAGEGKSKTFSIKGLRKGWVAAQREWTKISEDTGVGNPKMATAEKGKIFFGKTTDLIAEFLGEPNNADLDDPYI